MILKTLNKLVRAAFSQRRKKAKKLIAQQFSLELINNIYEEMSLNEGLRAENLSIEQYIEFAERINKGL